MTLTNSLLIDVSTGTVLTPHTCVIVPYDSIPGAEDGDMENMSDSEICDLGREHGRSIALDDQLVESIADALWGDGSDTEWGSDTLEAIADAIRALRPDLAKS